VSKFVNRGQISGCFLLSGSGPVLPRNWISEPDNSSAQMWPINLTFSLQRSETVPCMNL